MDRERVIQELESLRDICNARSNMAIGKGKVAWAVYANTVEDAIDMLKEQEARELTMDEWREWKTNKKRDPICMLWEYDTSPMWALNTNDVHEPAFLMKKLKLFTGKPTFEQCKAAKWE